MLELVGGRADAKDDPILRRGDNGSSILDLSMRGGKRQTSMLTHENDRASQNQGGAGTTLQNTFPASVTH